MKNLSTYKVFENEMEPIRKAFNRDQLSWLDKCTTGSWRYNPATGKVDVKGDFNCSNQRLTDFKGVEFGEISGEFRCTGNNLKSLEGSPVKVNGTMSVRDNVIESLVGSPEYVGGDFNCSDNKLETMDGAPRKVGKDFNCSDNYLKDLTGIPNAIGGRISIYGNEISSLRGIDDLESVEWKWLHPTWISENRLSGPTSVRIIREMTGNGLRYGDALRSIWDEIPDEDKVMLYKDLPGLTDQEAKAYSALGGFLGMRGFL
jgi:hypothetical protein